MKVLTIFDYSLGHSRRATQDDIDHLQRAITAMALRVHPEVPSGAGQRFDFRLAIFRNPMRADGVFIAEEKEIDAYPGITTLDGAPCYPTIPDTPWAVRSQLAPEFAAEIVRRWNGAVSPTE